MSWQSRGVLPASSSHPPCLRRIRRAATWLLALALLGSAVSPVRVAATEVSVVAIAPGRGATLVIDSGMPVRLEIGQSVEKVTLLRVERAQVEVSIDGTVTTLPLRAGAPAAPAVSSSSSVVLSADRQGHFQTTAIVNGKSVRMLVDTGASLLTLSRAEADRIGLSYRHGTPTLSSTANGLVRGWEVSLSSVRVGGVSVSDIRAMVVDTKGLTIGLLGMSFLDRFDLQRQGATLVLRRR